MASAAKGWIRGLGWERFARSATAVWAEMFALRNPQRSAAEPVAETVPLPRALRRIPEPEWPANSMQYRELIAIQARRRTAFWRALASVAVFYAYLSVASVLAPSEQRPLITAAFTVLFAVLAVGACYHGAIASFIRCPRCASLFHWSLRRLPFGPVVLLWRRCAHCRLNLDTAAPPLRGYFHRLFGVPDTGTPPLTQRLSAQLKAWRQRAEQRAPRAVRIAETLLFLAVSFAALFVIVTTM